MRIVVTGVPGTGKTVIAKKLSAKLKCPLIEVNKLVTKKKLWKRKGEFGEKIALMAPLRKALEEEMLKHENVVVEGHLACEFPLPAEKVIVLRTDPTVLEARLKKRKYAPAKTKENVFAELLDYCTIRSEQNYLKGKTIEFNTTRTTPASAAVAIARILEGKKRPKSVDWSGKLEEMV